MNINLIPDTSVSSAPSGFSAAVEAAAEIYDQDFPGNYTVNITYGWGTYDNQADPTLTNAQISLGGSDILTDESYATVKSWLAASATTSTAITAVASLPADNTAFPNNANTFLVSSAQEKALGVFSGNASAIDGSIGFGTQSFNWAGLALTEIGHALGWLTDYYAGGPTIADLFRYSAPGQYQWNGGQPAYFSIDGGKTDLANFSTSFDYTLFTNVAADDPFNVGGVNSASETLSSFDIEMFNAIGFGGSATPPPPPSPVSTDEWILANGKWAASESPGTHPAGYSVAAVGDWTGNGTDGILWFNSTNGDTDEWQLASSQWAASVDLGSHPGNYKISGVGDFFGNGIDDVLWTGSSGGSVQIDIWKLSSNGQWAASVSPGSHPAGYTVAGTGDWTGDGTAGILWYNSSTGDTDEWQLANGQWAGSVDLGPHPGSGWTIAGVGDFFDNGRDDVLWTNSSGGNVQTDIWELGSTGQWINSVSSGTHPAGYQVVGVGDLNGNGTTDILWQNTTSGDVDEWLINNGQWAGSVDLGTHPGNYQIAGVGSFTGTRTSDVLWAT